MKPMLAKKYDRQNIKGWLMSEKLDGVRAIWTGSELISRAGNKFFAPESFTAQLPSGVVLDGELYIGRGKFQNTVGIVRKHTPSESEWRDIHYCVFDAPEIQGGFEGRLEFCSNTLKSCEVAEVVQHVPCKGQEHLEILFDELCAIGAEGVMLRRPNSDYESGRSGSLLKYKPFISDEAEVVGYETGKGRLVDSIGTILCKWKNIIIKIGSGLSDSQRRNPPNIGAHITFKFQQLTDGGVPRFPVFLTERNYEQ